MASARKPGLICLNAPSIPDGRRAPEHDFNEETLLGLLLAPHVACHPSADAAQAATPGDAGDDDQDRHAARGEITTAHRINYNDGSRSIARMIDAGQAVSFETSGALCAKLLVLHDGETVAGPNQPDCDSSGSSNSSSLSMLATGKGRYRVAVSGSGAQSYGPFRIEARALQVHRGDAPLQPGADIVDFLSGGTRTYRLDIRQSGYYVIDMHSTELDSALELQGGGVSISDDDGGEGLNSRIRVPLEPGSYAARESADNKPTGMYRLAISTGALPAGVRLRNSGALATDGSPARRAGRIAARVPVAGHATGTRGDRPGQRRLRHRARTARQWRVHRERRWRRRHRLEDRHDPATRHLSRDRTWVERERERAVPALRFGRTCPPGRICAAAAHCRWIRPSTACSTAPRRPTSWRSRAGSLVIDMTRRSRRGAGDPARWRRDRRRRRWRRRQQCPLTVDAARPLHRDRESFNEGASSGRTTTARLRAAGLEVSGSREQRTFPGREGVRRETVARRRRNTSPRRHQSEVEPAVEPQRDQGADRATAGTRRSRAIEFGAEPQHDQRREAAPINPARSEVSAAPVWQ